MLWFGKKKAPAEAGNEREEAEESYVELPKVSAFPVSPAEDASESSQATLPAQPPTPYLEVRVGFLRGEFPLSGEVIRVGRADAEQNYRPDVDLGSDDAVSRRHAEIRRRGHQYIIVDLGSTNGTQLNGEFIVPHVETPLSDGDEIRLGAMSLLKVHLQVSRHA